MKILVEEKTVQKTVTEKTYKAQCDYCKKDFFDGDDGDLEFSSYDGVEWPVNGRGSYHHTNTAVILKETAAYPDDRSFEMYSYHICPDCMKTVILPFLQEKCGIPPHKNTDLDKE